MVDVGQKPLIIDYIILVCNGCRSERRFNLDPHLRTAEAIDTWLKSEPTPCGCGAKTCDARLHIVDES